MVDFGSMFFRLFTRFFTALISVMLEGLSTIINDPSQFGQNIGANVAFLYDEGVGAFVTELANIFTSIACYSKSELFTRIGNGLIFNFFKSGGGFSNFLEAAIDRIIGAIKFLVRLFSGKINIWEELKNFVIRFFTLLISGLKAGILDIYDNVRECAQAIGNWGSGIWEWVKKMPCRTILQFLKDTFPRIFEKIDVNKKCGAAVSIPRIKDVFDSCRLAQGVDFSFNFESLFNGENFFFGGLNSVNSVNFKKSLEKIDGVLDNSQNDLASPSDIIPYSDIEELHPDRVFFTYCEMENRSVTAKINQAIEQGKLLNRKNEKVKKTIDAGLFRKGDQNSIYPVRDGIPILLIDELIDLKKL